MKDKMTLDIRELDKTSLIGGHDKMWLFIAHSDPDKYLFERRWAIGYRNDGWWGVISLFPATHENAIAEIMKEMKLAKMAIKSLKQKQLSL